MKESGIPSIAGNVGRQRVEGIMAASSMWPDSAGLSPGALLPAVEALIISEFHAPCLHFP